MTSPPSGQTRRGGGWLSFIYFHNSKEFWNIFLWVCLFWVWMYLDVLLFCEYNQSWHYLQFSICIFFSTPSPPLSSCHFTLSLLQVDVQHSLKCVRIQSMCVVLLLYNKSLKERESGEDFCMSSFSFKAKLLI